MKAVTVQAFAKDLANPFKFPILEIRLDVRPNCPPVFLVAFEMSPVCESGFESELYSFLKAMRPCLDRMDLRVFMSSSESVSKRFGRPILVFEMRYCGKRDLSERNHAFEFIRRLAGTLGSPLVGSSTRRISVRERAFRVPQFATC